MFMIKYADFYSRGSKLCFSQVRCLHVVYPSSYHVIQSSASFKNTGNALVGYFKSPLVHYKIDHETLYDVYTAFCKT